MTLTELHNKAKREQWAVPHFNFSSLSQLQGILEGAVMMRAPVVVGTSEGEREFIGLTQAVDLVKSFRTKYDIPIFLNADHSKSYETAIAASDAGYDSVHIDVSKKSFEENLAETKKVVEYVKNTRPEVEVEGELGYLATESSKIYHEAVEIPEDSYTKVEEAVRYVKETGVNRFAPAIGNLHGIAANTPKIRFDLIESLTQELPANLTFVLHGGSGILNEDLRKIVELGFNNVHISTEIRNAFTKGLREFLVNNPEEINPTKYLSAGKEAVIPVIKEKLEIYKTVNVV
jgi:ketose-bisphosphate aldolase